MFALQKELIWFKPCDAFLALVAGEWTEGDLFRKEVSFRKLLAVSFAFLSSFTTTTMARAVSSMAVIQDCMLDSPSAYKMISNALDSGKIPQK
jgi:hypothetical protein